mmetsp:Transcript_9061/g.22587  ORF Transcript_9061/g.22587 Transcript_9061/m.22587 type:complete len:160 (+) Transcript_9061:490-969(+)
MRALTVGKRSAAQGVFVGATNYLLKNTGLGDYFFDTLQNRKVLRNVLEKAYGDTSVVTEELLDGFLEPAKDPKALEVFLAFVSYDTGPVPEDLLPLVKVPVKIAWGTLDRLEPIKVGRSLKSFPSVLEFVELPGVGHCPMDEVPDQINPMVLDFIAKHS